MLLPYFAIIITKQLTSSVRDHSIRHQRFTINGPLWPCVYLASLWRYETSNVGRTHSRTNAQVILYSVQCCAMHWADKNFTNFKTKVFVLVYSKNFVILICTVLLQSQSVTNTHTHTGISTIANTSEALHAVARKNPHLCVNMLVSK